MKSLKNKVYVCEKTIIACHKSSLKISAVYQSQDL